jgi:hypothetical protein
LAWQFEVISLTVDKSDPYFESGPNTPNPIRSSRRFSMVMMLLFDIVNLLSFDGNKKWDHKKRVA